MTARRPDAAGAARATAGGGSRPALRVEVNLTDEARPPSPAEEQAIALAVEEALRTTIRRSVPPGAADWRFSGRWWRTGARPGTVFPRCG